uniref:Uncharacterized protein n=1 Tax=Rhizophora mucronata TaxID=61149 RepID=A0A2P2MYL8_RHIMU
MIFWVCKYGRAQHSSSKRYVKNWEIEACFMGGLLVLRILLHTPHPHTHRHTHTPTDSHSKILSRS